MAQSGCSSSAAKADPHLSLLHRLHILNPSQELDHATALSCLSLTDLGNGFTEIQPHQIKEVLFSCTASLKELAV